MKSLFKKLIIIIAIIASTLIPISSAYADDGDESIGDCRFFLGMTSWDCGVDIKNINNTDKLTTGIWQIIVNILTDLSVIAAYLVVGYVIYGGYQYLTASGDPGKVATGKKTLTQAFVGLAIVMLSSIILNTIRIALGANFTGSDDCMKMSQGDASLCRDQAGDMVIGIIQWVVGVAGIVAIAFIILGGITYLTSSGDPSKTNKAKQTITYAVIGLIIVAFAEIITAFVSQTIRQAGDQTSLINETTIAKEVHNEN